MLIAKSPNKRIMEIVFVWTSSRPIKESNVKPSNLSVRLILPAVFALVLLAAGVLVAVAAPPVKGAVFTTNGQCNQVNGNIYENKWDVYINGGPKKPGAAGLPDGEYYVRVTQPNGKLLGTSIGSANDTPVQVVGGEFVQCLSLDAILIRASDGTPGYDDTKNPGGEYKVWVSNQPDFANNSTKTDNFKIRPGEIIGPQ